MIITADEQLRGGKQLPLKAIVDDALAMGGCESIRNVFVYERSASACPIGPPSDLMLSLPQSTSAIDRGRPAWVSSSSCACLEKLSP